MGYQNKDRPSIDAKFEDGKLILPVDILMDFSDLVEDVNNLDKHITKEQLIENIKFVRDSFFILMNGKE